VIPVLFDPSIKQLPDIFSMLYDLFIKSEGKKVQKIEQNNNGSINLVGDNNIIINDYRPCCNIGKNILKDTLNDGQNLHLLPITSFLSHLLSFFQPMD
jgi:hypothetical protein